jgi:hypothetical protein
MTQASTPLRVIYGGHDPRGCVLARVFPGIGTPMTVAGTSMPRVSPPPHAWAASARETARGQSRLRQGKVIFATSTLRR